MSYTIKSSDIWYKGMQIDSDFLTYPFLIDEEGNIIQFNNDSEKLKFIKQIKNDYKNKNIILDTYQVELLDKLEQELKGKELIKK